MVPSGRVWENFSTSSSARSCAALEIAPALPKGESPTLLRSLLTRRITSERKASRSTGFSGSGFGAGAEEELCCGFGVGAEEELCCGFGAGTEEELCCGFGAGAEEELCCGFGAGTEEELCCGFGAGAEEELCCGFGSDTEEELRSSSEREEFSSVSSCSAEEACWLEDGSEDESAGEPLVEGASQPAKETAKANKTRTAKKGFFTQKDPFQHFFSFIATARKGAGHVRFQRGTPFGKRRFRQRFPQEISSNYSNLHCV